MSRIPYQAFKNPLHVAGDPSSPTRGLPVVEQSRVLDAPGSGTWDSLAAPAANAPRVDPTDDLQPMATEHADRLLRQAGLPRVRAMELGQVRQAAHSGETLAALRRAMAPGEDGSLPARQESSSLQAAAARLRRLPAAAAIFLALRDSLRESLRQAYDQLRRAEELSAVAEQLGAYLRDLNGKQEELMADRKGKGDDPAMRDCAKTTVEVLDFTLIPYMRSAEMNAKAISVTLKSKKSNDDCAKVIPGTSKSKDAESQGSKQQLSLPALMAVIKRAESMHQDLLNRRDKAKQMFDVAEGQRTVYFKSLVTFIKQLFESTQGLLMNTRLT